MNKHIRDNQDFLRIILTLGNCYNFILNKYIDEKYRNELNKGVDIAPIVNSDEIFSMLITSRSMISSLTNYFDNYARYSLRDEILTLYDTQEIIDRFSQR